MIPERIIDKAWFAYIRSSNMQAIRNEMACPDLRGPTPPPPDPRQSLRAALEAVAADIWDEGHRTRVQRGPDECTCNAWNEDECACGNYGTGPIITPNPYEVNP